MSVSENAVFSKRTARMINSAFIKEESKLELSLKKAARGQFHCWLWIAMSWNGVKNFFSFCWAAKTRFSWWERHTGSAALFLSHFYKKYNAHQRCQLQKYGYGNSQEIKV
jgi:hypothetical protein